VKWKALIALFVLVATVVVPAAQSVMAENEISLFIVDEEKGNSEGKSFSPTEEHLPAYAEWTFHALAIQLFTPAYQLPLDRAVEMPTPPPDHC
jgi:hypothetical protein